MLCLSKVLGTTLWARTGTDDCFHANLETQVSASPYPYFQLAAAEDTAGGLALVIGSLGFVGPYVGGPP
jgi:hypothetical protein